MSLIFVETFMSEQTVFNITNATNTYMYNINIGQWSSDQVYIYYELSHKKYWILHICQEHMCSCRSARANLKNMLVCCLPTQKIRGGSQGFC